MVYRGRPSKGCHGCRSRKIACDQTRPSCLQCQRDGHVCPGYHDTLSLMFQNESLQTVRRPTAPKRKTKPKGTKKSREAGVDAQSASTSSSSSNALDRRLSTSSISSSPSETASNFPSFWQDGQIAQLEILRPSYQPTRDEAISWFLRHNASSGALFMIDFDPGVLARTNVSLGERTRMASLVAVGSAMLARARRHGEGALQLKQHATREYSQALTLMSQAVTNSVESKSNATLSAVLLLALFEVITNRTMGTVESWTRHIYGASALLDMRTQEELQNTESLNLFIQLRFQIIISCLQCGLPVPESLLDCNKIAMYLRPQVEAYCDRVIYITGQLSNLRAEIISGGLTDTGEILSRAYSMEAALTAWVASAPPEFLYTTIEYPSQPPRSRSSWSTTSGCTPPLYNNSYHLYNDLWTCHTWNQYRYSRILLCEIIIGCLRRISQPAGPAPGKDLQRQCTGLRKTSRDLASDICASVPYHLGADTPLCSGRGIPASQTYIGAMLLLWPLAVAGATECRAHPMRQWVIESLNLVGHAFGIDQALAVVEIMELEAGYFEDLDDAEDGSIIFLETDRTRNNRFVVGAWSAMLKAC